MAKLTERSKHWSLVAAIAIGPTASVVAIYALMPERETISFWQLVVMCSVTGSCG